MEVHEDPDRALSDGPNSLAMKDFGRVLAVVKQIDALIRGEERG
jgi:2-dehydro-3-deoxyphosphooctonate aldolase (KDO 8-P synthase)